MSKRGDAAREYERASETLRKLGKRATTADRDRAQRAEQEYTRATEQERRDGGRAAR